MSPSTSSAPILVVDDDEALRDALRDTLELEGYSVVDMGSAVDALEYLRRNPRPLLVLLDWNMEPMDAPAFMRELAKEPSLGDIPVVLVTADARAERKFSLAAFVAYLVKPVNLPSLFAIIRRFAAASTA
jgi:CheY-like chemotaxis protein